MVSCLQKESAYYFIFYMVHLVTIYNAYAGDESYVRNPIPDDPMYQVRHD